MTNAIALARNLEHAGLDKPAADAIAEAVVTHSDEHLATKADIARLGGKIDGLERDIKAMADKINLLANLVFGLYVGLAVLFVSNLTG